MQRVWLALKVGFTVFGVLVAIVAGTHGGDGPKPLDPMAHTDTGNVY